jgi:predicted DsbA family dithiol-disulfide isomerase
VAIEITHFSDPGCPWAYSANPALTVLRWRYGEQLRWRLVLIGLAESAEQYVKRGYTPARQARGYRRFRGLGMPLATTPRERIAATSAACRAVVAARLDHPDREWAVFRALQFAWFTTALVLDQADAIAQALSGVPGVDAAAIGGAIERPDVLEAYAADRAEARTAEGSATEFQAKAAATDGPVRYTAPSLIFRSGDRVLEAGGFQPVQAYDVAIANLARGMTRRPEAAEPMEVLDCFPEGLCTQEVAAVLTGENAEPDRGAAEDAMIDLAAEGRVERVALADDAIWRVRPGY